MKTGCPAALAEGHRARAGEPLEGGENCGPAAKWVVEMAAYAEGLTGGTRGCRDRTLWSVGPNSLNARGKPSLACSRRCMAPERTLLAMAGNVLV